MGDSLPSTRQLAKLENTRDSLARELEQRRQQLQAAIDQKSVKLDSIARKWNIPLDKYQLPNVNAPSMPLLQGVDVPKPQLQNLTPSGLKPNFTINTGIAAVETQVNEVEGNAMQLSREPKAMVQEKLTADEHILGVKSKLVEAKTVAEKVETYKSEVKDIRENGIERADQLGKDAEKKLLETSGAKELQVQDKNVKAAKNMLEEYQEMFKSMTDRKQLVEQGKEIIGTSLDPFAGHEEKLKAGIAQLDKLKKKYGTIPDSRYLPRRAPNPMKGKPFSERLVPGGSLQLFKGDRLAMDLQPYLAYKLSGRFRPGVGFSWRSAIWPRVPRLGSDGVYGYRVFNDFKLFGTSWFHTEAEWLHFNNDALARYKFPVDESQLNWKFRVNTGILRTYRISKYLDGQFQALYNIADLKRFPATKNTSIRFGFEIKIPHKEKH